MSNPIPDGAILTYNGTWPPGTYGGFADYTGSVFADLTNAGIAVRGVSGGFGLLNSALGTSFPIQLQLQVENGLGFRDVSDVISIVRGAVYQEAGAYPVSDSIPYVQATANGPAQTTGQPAAMPGAASTSSISDWFSNLTSKGLSTLGLVFIGLALGVVLLLTAQTKRSIGV